MPYKTDGSDVPGNIIKMGAEKRRQWAQVWNSAYERCMDEPDADRDDCEGSAFAQANGVVLDAEQEPGGPEMCVCPECGAQVEKERGIPCRAIDCPECGSAMIALVNNNEEVAMHDKETDSAEELTLTPEQEPEQEAEQAPPEDAPESTLPEDIPAEEPAAEMDSFGQVRDLLQSALDIITQMMPSDDGPEMPEEPPMEAAELAETFAEIAVSPVRIVEAETPADRRLPLTLDVGIIKVGPGNKRDNHYYTREMLERDGNIFEGLTMHTVDHREDLRSEGTDVSTVEEVLGVHDFDDGAYLVGRVVAYDPNFCEKTRNRALARQLGKLQCSILAKGEAQPGEIGGQQYNVVTGITEGKFVDWVTRAGAGGHAMAIAESAAEPEEDEEEAIETETETQELDVGDSKPVTLSEDAESTPETAENPVEEAIQSLALTEVVAALGKTNLPASSVAELANVSYQYLSELEQAVTAEVGRLKAAGSGAPLGIGTPSQPPPKSTREIKAEQQAVNRKWLRR